jgi:hypothetical protein
VVEVGATVAGGTVEVEVDVVATAAGAVAAGG